MSEGTCGHAGDGLKPRPAHPHLTLAGKKLFPHDYVTYPFHQHLYLLHGNVSCCKDSSDRHEAALLKTPVRSGWRSDHHLSRVAPKAWMAFFHIFYTGKEMCDRVLRQQCRGDHGCQSSGESRDVLAGSRNPLRHCRKIHS